MTSNARRPTADRRRPIRRCAAGGWSRQLRLQLCKPRHRLGTCELRSDDRSRDGPTTGSLLERMTCVKALHKGRDERVPCAEAVDDIHGVARDIDLGALVKHEHAALAALEHEGGDAEVEERLRVTRSGFDLLLVADHNIGMSCSRLSELDVRAWLPP